MMPRWARYYHYMRRLGSTRREALIEALANLRARRQEGFECPECKRWIVWSNFGICPYCKKKVR